MNKKQEKVVQLLNSGDTRSMLVLGQLFAEMTQEQLLVCLFHHYKHHLPELIDKGENYCIKDKINIRNAYNIEVSMEYYQEDGFEYTFNLWISQKGLPQDRFAMRGLFNASKDLKKIDFKPLRAMAKRRSPTQMIDCIIKAPLN